MLIVNSELPQGQRITLACLYQFRLDMSGMRYTVMGIVGLLTYLKRFDGIFQLSVISSVYKIFVKTEICITRLILRKDAAKFDFDFKIRS